MMPEPEFGPLPAGFACFFVEAFRSNECLHGLKRAFGAIHIMCERKSGCFYSQEEAGSFKVETATGSNKMRGATQVQENRPKRSPLLKEIDNKGAE